MWFFIFLLGEILIIPLYFLSVEHVKLQKKYGKEKGLKIGDALGMISGWCFFGFWIGLWFAPQPKFIVPFLQEVSFQVPFIDFEIPLVHFVLSLVFLIPGVFFGIGGVREVGLETAETHRPECVITSGLYAHVRHPQYLGGMLSHIGITFLISGLYSLFVTPFMILLNVLFCWKEEKELAREFGEEFENYKKKVPMFIPRLHASDNI
jgi:protein-S-isoprenylcysteine O-methyltransferase Ste14